MNESELKALLNGLLTRKSENRPSHQIIIGFDGVVHDLEAIEHFVSLVQEELDRSNSGTLDIFGVNSESNGGEFFIKCDENSDPAQLFSQIRPILDDFEFFEHSYVSLKRMGTDGRYDTDIQFIKKAPPPMFDEDPELPIPDGVSVSRGCFGSLAFMIVGTIVVFALYWF